MFRSSGTGWSGTPLIPTFGMFFPIHPPASRTTTSARAPPTNPARKPNAAERTLDGEARAEIMRYEGKGGKLKPWEKRGSETAGW